MADQHQIDDNDQASAEDQYHVSVLLSEVIDGLEIKTGGIYGLHIWRWNWTQQGLCWKATAMEDWSCSTGMLKQNKTCRMMNGWLYMKRPSGGLGWTKESKSWWDTWRISAFPVTSSMKPARRILNKIWGSARHEDGHATVPQLQQ